MNTIKQLVPFFTLLVGALLGFFISREVFTLTAPKITVNSFYDSQTASVNGEITAINGNTVTIKNNKNISSELPLSKNLAVMKTNNDGIPMVSSNTQDIELNKEAGIILQSVDGTLEVTTINYAPTFPPTPSQNPQKPNPTQPLLVPSAPSVPAK